ncbi:sodium:proton antiporter [Amycolatopsis sp. FDAARGOS 1241]|uniref:cation:proton antiporter n=1 Tax=Amycolatopsis sp. FDAARGOS 1241 TaxID=2778070 RepID=UPI001951B419|nr:cation:proton antiporter [Amycolatopsis sp. FDAARGOS 1241]QRP42684.1 cation:proton antiporter [Amycolatopsis sp. FDAARGOS 1241]
MSTDQILFGVALIVVLAVGSQVLASRLRIPALILLLPAGFTAGALTTDVNPERLLGAAFQPLVSLAVAVILYDAGLSLEWGKVAGRARHVVPRLVIWGVPVTMATTTVLAGPLLGMSAGAALMTGAILVVSGPTVVGPLLAFVRPSDRLQRILSWEGSLIDPVGGVLGAVVFHAVLASTSHGFAYQLGQFLISVGIGAAGAVVGGAVLWVCLCKLDLDGVLNTLCQLGCVVAVAAVCDIVRDDAGLIAAIFMGLAVANLRAFDVPARRPFFETLVQLIIGLMFVTISATVTPEALHHLVLPALGLVAVLVLVTRPLVAFFATIRTELPRGERTFVGWMAPRGIVAAATASTFGAELAAHRIGGAANILPVTFLVIVATVALYGLTAVPAARRLGVTRSTRSRPLLVGGDPWVIDLARAFRATGLDVLMWTPSDGQRSQIEQASLELAAGEQLGAAIAQGTAIDGVTTVLLLTGEDHYNALAATTLSGNSDTPLYRLAPSHGTAASHVAGEPLFTPALNHAALTARYTAGARITTHSSDGGIPPATDLLFLINAEGTLIPVTTSPPPRPQPGDTQVLLGRAGNETPQ